MKTKSIYNYLLNIQSPINNIDTLLTPILLAFPFMKISKKQNYNKRLLQLAEIFTCLIKQHLGSKTNKTFKLYTHATFNIIKPPQNKKNKYIKNRFILYCIYFFL